VQLIFEQRRRANLNSCITVLSSKDPSLDIIK